MASLKEIKGRIGSVESTLKITSAMKMVASAKLHKAQIAIENMLPYDKQLRDILQHFIQMDTKVQSPYSVERKVKRVAIIPIASNTSLCGGYNAGIIKHCLEMYAEYASLGVENIEIYPIGRKIAQALIKNGISVDETYKMIGDKTTYQEAATLAQKMMDAFVNGKVDKVELLYMHYQSTAVQRMKREQFLPLQLVDGEIETHLSVDYIVEPSAEEVMQALLPKTLRMMIYTVLLDASAAEHAARTIAMQTATDNANDLLGELRIAYNKGRQQAITNELLDIIGGSFS